MGIFQLLYLVIFLISANTNAPELQGLGFLEKEAKRYECYHDPEEGQSYGEWRECSKEEICEKGYSSDHYRPSPDDSEYVDNWVPSEKLNLLCEPKYKVGLLGSAFFIGGLVCVLTAPPLADTFGRQIVFIIVLILSIVA